MWVNDFWKGKLNYCQGIPVLIILSIICICDNIWFLFQNRYFVAFFLLHSIRCFFHQKMMFSINKGKYLEKQKFSWELILDWRFRICSFRGIDSTGEHNLLVSFTKTCTQQSMTIIRCLKKKRLSHCHCWVSMAYWEKSLHFFSKNNRLAIFVWQLRLFGKFEYFQRWHEKMADCVYQHWERWLKNEEYSHSVHSHIPMRNERVQSES